MQTIILRYNCQRQYNKKKIITRADNSTNRNKTPKKKRDRYSHNHSIVVGHEVNGLPDKFSYFVCQNYDNQGLSHLIFLTMVHGGRCGGCHDAHMIFDFSSLVSSIDARLLSLRNKEEFEHWLRAFEIFRTNSHYQN